LKVFVSTFGYHEFCVLHVFIFFASFQPEEEDHDDEDDAADTKFIGYICEHAYAGAVNGDTLKGADLAFWHLFKPQHPGTRVAQIEIRMSGPTAGDDTRWIKGPGDFHGCVVEVCVFVFDC
jgi:hypothetical protein